MAVHPLSQNIAKQSTKPREPVLVESILNGHWAAFSLSNSPIEDDLITQALLLYDDQLENSSLPSAEDLDQARDWLASIRYAIAQGYFEPFFLAQKDDKGNEWVLASPWLQSFFRGIRLLLDLKKVPTYVLMEYFPRVGKFFQERENQGDLIHNPHRLNHQEAEELVDFIRLELFSFYDMEVRV
jgi:hypothetical protein